MPAMYGNFHIAPSPIADPALAKINPVDVFHCDSLLNSSTPFNALKRLCISNTLTRLAYKCNIHRFLFLSL